MPQQQRQQQIADLVTELTIAAQDAGLWGQDNIRQAIETLPLIPDEEARQERASWLLRNLTLLATRRGAETHPFLPYPDADLLGDPQNGAVLLGIVDTLGNEPEFPVGIPLDRLTVHMLAAGPCGKGKSMFALSVLAQLAQAEIPMWIFDTVGEYADLMPVIDPAVTTVRFSDFRRNPFHGPAGISLEDWLQHMTSYLREAFFFRDGTINLFRDVCRRVIADGKELNSRTFADEFPKVPLKIRRLMDYYESLKRFVTSLEMPTYNCTSGFDLAALSHRAVVFDLQHMSSDNRLFFIADLLTWLDASCGYERDRSLGMVTVLDELSQFFSEQAVGRVDLGEPFILQMLRMSRKKGIGVILADQTYHQFHEVIRSNCQTKIIFETHDGPSRRDIAWDLGLNRDQESFLQEMSFGQENRRILVQLATYPKPMLLTLPNWEKPAEKVEYRPPDLAWTPLPELAAEEKQKQRDRDQVTHEMEYYLGVIAGSWWMSKTQHDDAISKGGRKWSRQKGGRVRNDLKALGLLEEHTVNQYEAGKQIDLVIPTRAGYELLDRRRISYRVPEGNGGIPHRYWQRTIKLALEKEGCKCRIEQCLNSKRVDVGCIAPLGEKIAYEILMEGLEKELENLRDLEDGWNRIVFCVADDETKQKLHAILPDAVQKVEIRLLKEFL